MSLVDVVNGEGGKRVIWTLLHFTSGLYHILYLMTEDIDTGYTVNIALD